jgi:LysM repeat protein
MNQPNPFVPQGSLLEQHKRRSRLKLAVLCTVVISAAGLSAMLIQGCKREQNPPETPVETNTPAMLDTNPPVVMGGSNAVVIPPVAPEPPATSEYVVLKGDTLGKIAKDHHTTVKAIEDANPGVTPTKLKVGQKLAIPGGTSGAATTSEAMESAGGGETYVVKSGDSFTKIASTHGISLKALKAANPNVDPNHIKTGQKLKIPAKSETPSTTVNTPPAPVAQPAPTSTPPGQ